MDENFKSLIKQGLVPPKTKRSEQFINSIEFPKAKLSEVLISQIGFIRKRVWVLFFLTTCLSFIYTEFTHVPENIVVVVSAILPLFSLCTISEIYKSTAYNMEETELTCKYNLPRITLMRLSILGSLSFLLLILLVLIVGRNELGLLRNMVYIAVPYLLTSYICLLVIAKYHSRETIYICASISGMVSILSVLASINYQFIYNVDFTIMWIITFVVLLVLLFFTLMQFTKSLEELQWNLL